MLSPEIINVISSIKKLPSIGNRSAKRLTLSLLQQKDKLLYPLIESLTKVADIVTTCQICGNLDTQKICNICSDPKRDRSFICILETVEDLWSIEQSKVYNGLYHVLGGYLSALHGKTPQDLNIATLLSRIKKNDDISANDLNINCSIETENVASNLSSKSPSNLCVQEIILALNTTLDGQTTALYITEHVQNSYKNIKITKLAAGIPIGGEIEYLDEGTLNIAFNSRNIV